MNTNTTFLTMSADISQDTTTTDTTSHTVPHLTGRFFQSYSKLGRYLKGNFWELFQARCPLPVVLTASKH